MRTQYHIAFPLAYKLPLYFRVYAFESRMHRLLGKNKESSNRVSFGCGADYICTDIDPRKHIKFSFTAHPEENAKKIISPEYIVTHGQSDGAASVLAWSAPTGLLIPDATLPVAMISCKVQEKNIGWGTRSLELCEVADDSEDGLEALDLKWDVFLLAFHEDPESIFILHTNDFNRLKTRIIEGKDFQQVELDDLQSVENSSLPRVISVETDELPKIAAALGIDPTPFSSSDNPFNYLGSIREDQKLFGRDDEIRQLESMVISTDNPIVLLSGSSGIGKTSLIQAGLFNKLRENGYSVLKLSPGAALFKTLLRYLHYLDSNTVFVETTNDPDVLLKHLIDKICQFKGYLLITVDQFERFTSSKNKTDNESYERFLKLIKAVEEETNQNVTILISGRSDDDKMRTLSGNGQYATMHLDAPSKENLKKAFLGPLSVYSSVQQNVNLLNDSLIETILHDLTLCAKNSQLPFMQLTAAKLYAKCGFEATSECMKQAYEDMGKVEGVLTNLADQTIAVIENNSDICRNIFLSLEKCKTISETNFKIENDISEKSKQYETVIKALINGRLVNRKYYAGIAYLEPAHDILMENWDKLDEWRKIEGERARRIREELYRDSYTYYHTNDQRDLFKLWTGGKITTARDIVDPEPDTDQFKFLSVAETKWNWKLKKFFLAMLFFFVGIVFVAFIYYAKFQEADTNLEKANTNLAKNYLLQADEAFVEKRFDMASLYYALSRTKKDTLAARLSGAIAQSKAPELKMYFAPESMKPYEKFDQLNGFASLSRDNTHLAVNFGTINIFDLNNSFNIEREFLFEYFTRIFHCLGSNKILINHKFGGVLLEASWDKDEEFKVIRQATMDLGFHKTLVSPDGNFMIGARKLVKTKLVNNIQHWNLHISNIINYWDIYTGVKIGYLELPCREVNDLKFDDSGERLVVGCATDGDSWGKIFIANIKNSEILIETNTKIYLHPDTKDAEVTAVEFVKNKKQETVLFASGNTIRNWDFAQNKILDEVFVGNSRVIDIRNLSNLDLSAAATSDGNIYILDTKLSVSSIISGSMHRQEYFDASNNTLVTIDSSGQILAWTLPDETNSENNSWNQQVISTSKPNGRFLIEIKQYEGNLSGLHVIDISNLESFIIKLGKIGGGDKYYFSDHNHIFAAIERNYSVGHAIGVPPETRENKIIIYRYFHDGRLEKVIHLGSYDKHISNVIFSPNGRYALVIFNSKEDAFLAIDLEKKNSFYLSIDNTGQYPGFPNMNSIAFSNHSNSLFYAISDNGITTNTMLYSWNIAEDKLEYLDKLINERAQGFGSIPEKGYYIAFSKNKLVVYKSQECDVSKRTQTQYFDREIESARFSIEGEYLGVLTSDGVFHIFDTKIFQQIMSGRGFDQIKTKTHWRPLFAFSGLDRFVFNMSKKYVSFGESAQQIRTAIPWLIVDLTKTPSPQENYSNITKQLMRRFDGQKFVLDEQYLKHYRTKPIMSISQ